MTSKPTNEEATRLKRVADEPWYWVRENVAEVAHWENELHVLLESVKVVWQEYRINRINLAFLIKWTKSSPPIGTLTMSDVAAIQKQQNAANSQLIFEVDLDGNVLDVMDIGSEIDPTAVMILSQSREAVIMWFGHSLDIFYKGMKWNPKNKAATLKEMKLKKRDELLPLTDYRRILETHYEQYIRGESGVDYWFPGEKNKVLRSSPERIFQKSLYIFLKNDCECDAALEPMFKDSSRCDVRASIDYDIYFFEIKWIGFCATKKKDLPVESAEKPREEEVKNAIAGTYQTKKYIEQNNSIEYDNKIKLGVVVVYNAYPNPHIPIDYPQEIKDFPLLDTAEFALVTVTPSVHGKRMAKQRRSASKKR